MIRQANSSCSPVLSLASPVSHPFSILHSSFSEGPAALCMAPSIPPPPIKVLLAALTMASISSLVMSPCHSDILLLTEYCLGDAMRCKKIHLLLQLSSFALYIIDVLFSEPFWKCDHDGISDSVIYLSPHSYLVRLSSKGMFCQYSLSEQKIDHCIIVNNFVISSPNFAYT